MTNHSDIDSRDSDSVSNYLDSKLRKKRLLIKKKTKKIKSQRRKNTRRKRAFLSKRTKKDLRRLKRDQFKMTSKQSLAIRVTNRVV